MGKYGGLLRSSGGEPLEGVALIAKKMAGVEVETDRNGFTCGNGFVSGSVNGQFAFALGTHIEVGFSAQPFNRKDLAS